MHHLSSQEATAPMPTDAAFARNEVHIIASAAVSLRAAADEARRQGVDAVVLSDSIEGEAREVAKMHAAIARETSLKGSPFSKPVVILSGGETTVTLQGKGKGGRNSEFILSFAKSISGYGGIDALAADTDGVDGSEVLRTECATKALTLRTTCGRMTPGPPLTRLATCSIRDRPERM
jgi:hydroxypyruvate reductase